ncbi:hypothetical protein CMV30_12155 [Nibricoccus aquaticus]|uniref:mannan endo-1,4-beta-mannosidase n=1 Tax=Nibricoccus aquaticus TaxID=2576891 RepID=A0A290Q7M2_9BACT|nr:cellulase family glycosylhydrolase [Nibricoccus aquaticus]ATC64649.1 hypothetical protein CMV30_12155 [Nibricoccus aquaticus]
MLPVSSRFLTALCHTRVPFVFFALLLTSFAQTFNHELNPGANWAAGMPNPVITLDSNGAPSPAMSTVSSYLHGSWHTAYGRTVTFTATLPSAAKIGLIARGVSSSGTKTVVLKEAGVELARHTFTVAETWEVLVTAGTHTFTFENVGEDWVDISTYYLRDSGGVQPPGSVTATVTAFSWLTSSVPAYAKAEAAITLSRTYTNPYDPDIVSVDALVTGPGGITYTLPAFWYEPVTWETRTLGTYANFTAPSAGSWRIRLTPEAAGAWSVAIRITDTLGQTTSAAQPLQVTAATATGFVALDATDRQGFRFDNGDPFIPLGFNLCWNDGSLGTFFSHYFGKMAANGCNWTRVWMTPFARQSIEWSADHWFGPYAGLGRYAQEPAALMDFVIDQATTSGVYLQMVLEHHGLYSTTTNPMWSENPYNTAKGGTLASPAQFFTDTGAIAQAKKKYRYIVARWSYSPHVLAWELFNEANFTNGTNADVASWHRTMSTYLKSIDPYGHLVTTSTSRAQLDLLDTHPAIDVLQEHTYADPIAQAVATLDDDLLAHYAKPVAIGEYGSGTWPNAPYAGPHPDTWGDHIRQCSWIGSLKRVPNMFWFWDDYLQRYDLFSAYQPLARFWSGEDPRHLTNSTPALAINGVTTTTLRGYALQNPTSAYAYVLDRSFGEWAASPPAVTGATLTLNGLTAGNWQIYFFNPQTGAQQTGPLLTATTGTELTISLPAFTKDLALKLRPTASRETYAQWRGRLFHPAEIVSGLAEKSSVLGGGTENNLLKYALGHQSPATPLAPAQHPELLPASATTRVFRFPTPATGVTYRVQTSTDLITWTTVQTLSEPTDLTTNVTLTVPLNAPRFFARLEVAD